MPSETDPVQLECDQWNAPTAFLRCIENFLTSKGFSAIVSGYIAIASACINAKANTSKDNGKVKTKPRIRAKSDCENKEHPNDQEQRAKSLAELPPIPFVIEPLARQMAGEILVNHYESQRVPSIVSFCRAYAVGIDHLRSFLMPMLDQKCAMTIKIIDQLNVHGIFPPDLVLSAAVRQQAFESADRFARYSEEYQHVYINLLVEKSVPDKIIKRKIAKFRLKAQDFPDYCRRKERSMLRYMVYSKQYDEALEFVQTNEAQRRYVCEFMVEQHGLHDPLTRQFIHQCGLSSFFSLDKSEKDHDEHVSSNLLHDEFMQRCDPAPMEGFLYLKDLVGADHIHFVDNKRDLAKSIDYLCTQKVVGFDCEWRPSNSFLQPNANCCALLQLASHEDAFVVDMIALQDVDIGDALVKLFEAKSVLKLAFDAKGDVKAIRSICAKTKTKPRVHFRPLLDLQLMFRRLRNRQLQQQQQLQVQAQEHECPQNAKSDDSQTESSTSEGPMNDIDNKVNGKISATGFAESSEPTDDNTATCLNDAGSNGPPTLTTSNKSGLSTMAEKYLKMPLDKRVRMTNWEKRPLTRAQLHYAALDAYVLVLLYKALQEAHSDDFDKLERTCIRNF